MEICENPFLRAPIAKGRDHRWRCMEFIVRGSCRAVVPVVCSEVPDFAVPGFHPSYSISEHLRHRQEVTLFDIKDIIKTQ